MIRSLTFPLLVSLIVPVMAWAQTDSVYNGITESAADAELSFGVSGVLATCQFHEGDYVPQGEVICSLEHKTEQLEIARRQVILDNARLDLKRTQQLYDKTGSVSEEELDEKRATVKVAETEFAIAEESVNRRLLVAPFSGIIANLYGRDPGEGAELLTPIVRLVDTSKCLFVCNLPLVAANGVKVGAKISLQIGDVTCEGTVSFVSPVLDPSSGLLTVKATFENPDGRIVPGAAGQLRFLNP